MTTLTVVKKGETVAIAADGLTTFGDTRLARSYKGEHDKILDIAGSKIGTCGSSAHHLVLLSAFSKLEDVKLGSRMEVYETFRRLHPILKEHAFLNTKEDEDDPCEQPTYDAAPVNLLTAKQRTGPTGDVHLTFLTGFTRFESAAKVADEDAPRV